MVKFDELGFSKDEIEAFKELGNTGAGHSAIALTKLLKREMNMSVPFLRIGYVREIIDTLGLSPDVLVGYEILPVNDVVNYRLAVVFQSAVMIDVLQMLSSTSKEVIEKDEDLTDMQKSLLQEIGSTIILRYVAALNKMLKINTIPDTAPIFKINDLQTALSEIGYKGEKGEEIPLILIQLDLFTEEKKFEAHLFIQPHVSTREEYRKAFKLK